MAKGRKATPTKLKVLRGNPGKRPLPKSEPQPPTVPADKVPKPPSWLDGKAKHAWRHVAPLLADIRVLTRADRHALELLVDAYSEWRDCRAAVRKHGPVQTVRTKAGGEMVRQRPEVAMAANAWRRVMAALAEFGLTPASRTRVAGDVAETDPLEEFLRRGRA